MKKRTLKQSRVISLLLAVMMIISSIPLAGLTAFATNSKIEQAIQYAINIANDNSHGYSQRRRYGNPDYDCSSLVAAALNSVGFGVGWFTTSTMGNILTSKGFTRHSFTGLSNCQRGDILWRNGHTEIYIGNNQSVGAHMGYIDIYDDNYPGDQTGREINVANCGSNWTYIFRYGSDNNNDPIGSFDEINAGYGYIHIRGWAFDPDEKSKNVAIHVYIGGGAGQSGAEEHHVDISGKTIYANATRADVNKVYGCGDNHGFDVKIPTNKTGNQSVYVYALNTVSGNNPCIGSKIVNIPKDTTKPVISNVTVTNSHNGYTVSCKVTDNDGIDRVQFPTWTLYNGQDDLLRDWGTSTKASGTKEGDTYTFTVKTSDHKNETGVYATHIYAYDKSGNTTCYEINAITIANAITHTWDSGKVTKAATCTDAGIKTYICTVCGEEKTEEIPATGHQFEVYEAIEPTETEPGNIAYNHCTECGKNFPANADKFADDSEAIADVTLPPVNIFSDEESGITVDTDKSELPTDTELVVTVKEETEDSVTYDISLQSGGVEVQPTGSVTVKIPIPETMDGESVKVYRREADGTMTDMNAAYKDGYMVFTTEHFSEYKLTTASGALGDVNGDGNIDPLDVLIVKRYIAEFDDAKLEGDAFARADVNGDGKVDPLDVLFIMQKIAEIIDNFDKIK